MSLLSHNQLLLLIKEGVIENSRPEHVNSASIDLTLGKHILAEVQPEAYHERMVNLAAKESIKLKPCVLTEEASQYILAPGDFILAQTEQVFHLPRYISAEYKLKSTLARNGLQHMLAGWCDAGWHGSVLTMEFKNVTHHHLIIELGMKIGQMVFFEHELVPQEASYAAKGQYNRDTQVTGGKHLR